MPLNFGHFFGPKFFGHFFVILGPRFSGLVLIFTFSRKRSLSWGLFYIARNYYVEANICALKKKKTERRKGSGVIENKKRKTTTDDTDTKKKKKINTDETKKRKQSKRKRKDEAKRDAENLHSHAALASRDKHADDHF